jgi:phosphoglycolate phosphatase-like HAD superfamily hydrolase
MMPLGNRAEDYGTSLCAIEDGRRFPDQQSYDRYRAARDAEWLALYHARFYEVRREMERSDPAGWRALMRPYGEFVELLRRRRHDAIYAIATSKDSRSVALLLEVYGLSQLFPAERVFDKETGPDKRAHLQRVRESLGEDFRRMTFVDDKVNHLDRVATLGVRCALATWGYNGPREHALAKQRGYVLCTLHDAESRLFESNAEERSDAE